MTDESEMAGAGSSPEGRPAPGPAPGHGSGPGPSAAVRFRRLPHNPDLPLPARATAHAAGYDVRAAEEVVLGPGEIKLVATGLVMELPLGVECQVRPRSGLALRHGLTLPNSPGTIDPDFRGELKVILQNLGPERVELDRGERVAQLVFARFEVLEVEEVAETSETQRGTGGFGSTGTV